MNRAWQLAGAGLAPGITLFQHTAEVCHFDQPEELAQWKTAGPVSLDTAQPPAPSVVMKIQGQMQLCRAGRAAAGIPR